MNPYCVTQGVSTLACLREPELALVSGTLVLSTGLQIDFEVRRGSSGEFYSNVYDHGSLCGEMCAVFFDSQYHSMRQPTHAEIKEVLGIVTCVEGIAILKNTLAARVWSAQPARNTQPHSITAARVRYLRAAMALSKTRLTDPDDLYAALAVSSSLFFQRAYHVLASRM